MPCTRHLFTIAQNGTILEASTTITGFSNEALLMTSVYDSLFDEDLPGFLCIKSQFWDKGDPGAEVYVRRRSIDGMWIWLLSKAVGFLQEGGISAILLEETLVENVEIAESVNRTIKISSVLIQAVEASWLVRSTVGESKEDGEQNRESEDECRTSDGGNTRQQISFNPEDIIDSLRQGVRLDLGLTKLLPEDSKFISLMLTGRLSVSDVVPKLRNATELAYGLRGLTEQYTLDCERSYDNHQRKMQNLFINRGWPPPISVVNLSYTYMGSVGMELLSEIIYREGSFLKAVDISFCNIEERGFKCLAQAFCRRRDKNIPAIRGLILSGNYIAPHIAAALGSSLAPSSTALSEDNKGNRTNESSTKAKLTTSTSSIYRNAPNDGLLILHLSQTSMTGRAASLLIKALGANSTVRELNLSSNDFGKGGAPFLSQVFESQIETMSGKQKKFAALPFLERLDVSNNNLGDDGMIAITKALQKRKTTNFVDLRLSYNFVGSVGLESVIANLLHYNLKSLSLDKNNIGDSGCQLVASSLLSMKSLCRLNLGFNHIGSRGITSLMRSLITCDSITYLGISGNILKISGSIALAFLLAQHPRLEELDVENCCLDEASQCHIVAGIISNRLVPMKRLKGFSLGPPMAVISALEPQFAQLSNEECLKIRLNLQMRTILQWMESNRMARQAGQNVPQNLPDNAVTDFRNARFLSPDFVASMNDNQGAPSQNPYFRLLGWLSRIPFYEEELTALQKFFYDADGGEGDRGSDGQLNLKIRGDLLAALDADTDNELRDQLLRVPSVKGSVGIDIDLMFDALNESRGEKRKEPSAKNGESRSTQSKKSKDNGVNAFEKTDYFFDSFDEQEDGEGGGENEPGGLSIRRTKSGREQQGSQTSCRSTASREKRGGKPKPRISLFPVFEQQLDELKLSATDLIEKEDDTSQHEIILTQYAEAVLVILRQLRYLCMNCGLDGWRRSNLKRKVLIVDDTLSTRKLVARAFENANYIVDTAPNGAEGVKKAKASLYDIVFMDIEMPVMDGIEATKQLRKWEDENRPGARQPICALTGKDATKVETRVEFKDAGIDVFEKKPCHIPRLFKVVDDVSPMFSDLSTNVTTMEQDQSLRNVAQSPEI